MKTKSLLLLAGAGLTIAALSRNRAAAAGVAGLGVDSAAKFAPNAVVAPQFTAEKPGIYAVDVIVEGVRMDLDQRPLLSPEAYTSALHQKGYNNATVLKVTPITWSGGNPRSSGGSLDIFNAGVPIADFKFRLTISVADTSPAGLGDLGVAAIWVAAAIFVAADLLLYALSGKSIIITAVRFVGKVLAEAITATITPLVSGATSIAVPLLLAAGAVLFMFKKSGARVSTRSFGIGGG